MCVCYVSACKNINDTVKSFVRNYIEYFIYTQVLWHSLRVISASHIRCALLQDQYVVLSL